MLNSVPIKLNGIVILRKRKILAFSPFDIQESSGGGVKTPGSFVFFPCVECFSLSRSLMLKLTLGINGIMEMNSASSL